MRVRQPIGPLVSLLVGLHALTAVAAATLKFDAPKGWTPKATSSPMRVAEFSLSPAAGDPGETTLTVYFFGGQGGSVEANLDRWIGQMEQPDGRASKDAAKRRRVTVHGLSMTLLDVGGAYTAETAPGSGQRVHKPHYRMKAAVVETPKGPYFVKLTGPEKTVAKWESSFDAFMQSMRME